MSQPSQEKPRIMGTFAGVFTPSLLTILGLILFLRLSFVVGSTGLLMSLVIILLANSISVLTTFSLAAIATNIHVKQGGDYYLISRTLGPDYGGAIGIVLFLSQSFSIGFYCMGFGEIIYHLLAPTAYLSPQLIALVAIAFLSFMAWLGTDWATRFQFVVMIVLGVALIAFFIGAFDHWQWHILKANLLPQSSSSGFWLLFAIFFPAVTGFTQGVSMSGELKDPGHSLPLGTFAAVTLSIIIYCGCAIAMAAVRPLHLLATDYQSMAAIAWSPTPVTAGIIAATLSSAMASFLGAPRILQSVAADKIFTFLTPFSLGRGANNNPTRGIALSTFIASSTIALGELNHIAVVVTTFFLISYGLLNYATYYEAQAASPSFRPRFHWYHPNFSLIGALLCFIAILAIDWRAGGVALLVVAVIRQYLHMYPGHVRWSDSRHSHYLFQLRQLLLVLSQAPQHPRDWRPQLLIFSNSIERRTALVEFSMWISAETGLITLVQIVEGLGLQVFHQRHEAEQLLKQQIDEHNWELFPLVVAAPDLDQGNALLLQSFGIGPLRANTIVLNLREPSTHSYLNTANRRYGKNLRTALRFGYNVILLDHDPIRWQQIHQTAPSERQLDVWYQNTHSGATMLLFAHLMTRTSLWKDATIRILCPAPESEQTQTRIELDAMLKEVRIDAQVVIIPTDESYDFSIFDHTTLAFLPLKVSGASLLHPLSNTLVDLDASPAIVALVGTGKALDLEAAPDEGPVADLAAAEDRLDAAEEHLKLCEQQSINAIKTNEGNWQQYMEARHSNVNELELHALLEVAQDSYQAVLQSTRQSARAEVNVEICQENLQQLRNKLL